MGKVYIVGAGPGDPDLITVKGLKCIEKADVILYDRLVNKELLSYAKPEADLIYCGKLPNYHTMKQETINTFLIKYAKKGKIVTRLKGGDPFVFGRGGEEAEALAKQGVPFEIVPGIPVTHRDASASFAIVTGHRKEDAAEEVKWGNLAKGVETLAVYMGVSNLPYICEQLMKHGKDKSTPAAIIERGTTSMQRTVVGTLGTIVDVAKKEQIQNPSMIVIGEVVRFREKIHWFEKQTESTYQVSGVL
ncbi:uroporphyrinogen-III C-methyltransferase [Bacillus anthracis]|uniref:uroporphyrinogen-III C-methyltransferase n=1 Tax=Bacillus anthracis TaxID=1392 RepID=UPI001ADF3AFE|nr:uroporphyrinogen-III C-methyltransferase [Bacillus anthracis]MBP0887988.1 uroporphyrinogen-III C-methyltransferase [Bacillus anthracis]